jgi:hypothetical protein
MPLPYANSATKGHEDEPDGEDEPRCVNCRVMSGGLLRARIALDRVRSLIHNLPRSHTANEIDNICADALGEPRTP